MRLILSNITCLKPNNTYQIGEIGDPRQTLVDDELEGNCREHEGEGQLKSILGQAGLNGEGDERKAANQELRNKIEIRIELTKV